jgi:hypothetical protein
MSQRAFLQALDANIAGAFRDAGMADTGSYTPPEGGAATPGIDVLVDRNVALYDEEGAPIDLDATLVTIFLSQVAAPARGGVVTIDGGDSFRLVKPDRRDESMSRWVVADV